jgi:hypothetical protein
MRSLRSSETAAKCEGERAEAGGEPTGARVLGGFHERTMDGERYSDTLVLYCTTTTAVPQHLMQLREPAAFY